MFISFFFFSSRRRHTRSLCDWSSDVCSSDLRRAEGTPEVGPELGHGVGKELDLTLSPLLGDTQLGGERLPKGGAAIAGRPAENQGEADQRRDGRQEGEHGGGIHSDGLSAPTVVSTSVRPVLLVRWSTFSATSTGHRRLASALERRAWKQPGRLGHSPSANRSSTASATSGRTPSTTS